MANWKKSKNIRGPSRSGPVVHVTLPALTVQEIQFATPSAGSDFKYIYLSDDSHPQIAGSVGWWGKGAKITTPEWVAGRDDDDNRRACFTRNRPVSMRVKLVCATTSGLTGTLTATPTLDGASTPLSAVSVSFNYGASTADLWVTVVLGGNLPDEVARFLLKVQWTATGMGFTFTHVTSRHKIYCAYGQPFRPEYDSPSDADPGLHTAVSVGTLTGTAKRLDKLTELIGSKRRHATATADDIVNLLWKLHVGINDTPGAPPYFDAAHTEHLSVDGTSKGATIPLEDQWLAWLSTGDPHWNDASCIGHVQILKTMAASIGLFARRTWVFPTTSKLPDGSTAKLADTEMYCLGSWNPATQQSWTFTYKGRPYVAQPKLMEPGTAWENFEACLRSPNGRFLPGGYNTSSCPPSFRSAKGFGSAAELIRWWSVTSRPSFGQRFMCWLYENEALGEYHCWDVDGTHYDIKDYVLIRDAGKQLPPP